MSTFIRLKIHFYKRERERERERERSKSHRGSKQAFALHFIPLRPAIFLKLSKFVKVPKHVKIILSHTAGLTISTPHFIHFKAVVYEREERERERKI